MSRRLCVATVVMVLMMALGVSNAASAPLTTQQIKNAQIQLKKLGFWVGPTDGIVGPFTSRGMCAFNYLYGLRANLGTMNIQAYRKLMQTDKLRRAARSPRRYLSVVKRCQVLYDVRRHRYFQIIPVSTGMRGVDEDGEPFATTSGDRQIYRRVRGWSESRRYKNGWMHNASYFYGGEAMHGVRLTSSVAEYRASHGCVRILMRHSRALWDTVEVGTPFYVR